MLYALSKRGTGERAAGGRTFTDLEPHALTALLRALGLSEVEVWLTDDSRPERREQWVNGMGRKRRDERPGPQPRRGERRLPAAG